MELLLRLTGISHLLSITVTQFFLIIFTIILVRDYYKKRISLKNCPYFKFYVFLVIAGFLSVIFGVNPRKSIVSFRDEWLLFYFFVGYYYVPHTSYKRIFASVLFGAFIASLYAYYQFFIKLLERAQGFYSHSLTFGNVVSILAVFCFTYLLTNSFEEKWERNYYLITFLILLIALYISGSRGPILFTIITICISLIFIYGRKGAIVGVFVLILFCIVAYVFYTNPALNRRFHELENESFYNSMSSIGTRIALWKASFKIIKVYPFFGIGYGNFKGIIKSYIDVPVLTTAHAHNAYIQYLVLHGITGFICLIAFLYKIFLGFVKKIKKDKLAIVGLSIFIVFLLQGTFENNFYDSEVAMLLWFLTGSILGIVEKKEITESIKL
jgi:O-antigen ligase